jgi:prepilin-type processing-associated H-X9-DG protein
MTTIARVAASDANVGYTSRHPMTQTTTQCPHCGFAYAVTPGQAAAMSGQSFGCTNCGQPFMLVAGGAAFARVAAAATAADMAGVTYASGAHARSNPLAIASLICGCLLCVPFVTGIASIITGAFGMRKARDPAVTGKGMAIAGLTLGILNVVLWGAYFGLIFAIMVPTMGMARQTANQVKCSSNLKQIGLALAIYANQNGGAFPDTIEQFVADPAAGLTSAVYDCPGTPITPPATKSPQVLAGSGEYVYVGKGLTNKVGPMTVLAYEPVANHGTGANILYADGSVTFMTEPNAGRIIRQLESGQNPPKLSGVGVAETSTTAPAEVEQ